MATLDRDDVNAILGHFERLEDPRSTINRKHLLGDLIIICVCAVVAGADGPKAIGTWAASNGEWLRGLLKLPNGIPSHDTIGRLLRLLKPEAFQECFQQWSLSLRPDNHIASDELAGEERTIAIDGKALRRSHDKKHNLGALFIVSAWAVEQGISLGQLATEEKSNEITAIPELLDKIDVKGATVTIDAAGCQKNIAAKIVAGQGDYVLALKGNQGQLYHAADELFADQLDMGFPDLEVRMHQETCKKHGRIDVLTYYQFKVPSTLPGIGKWAGLRAIGVAVRHSTSKDGESFDVRFFISSMRLSVKRFAKAVRGHWAIENTLHWCLDITFREDESRVRERHAADNLAWLRRFAISLLKQCTDKESIAMRRRMAAWNTEYLAQVIEMPRT